MIERVNAGAVGSAPPIEQPNQTRGLQGFVRDALETIAAQLRRLGGVRLDPTRVEAAAPEAVRAEEDRRVLVSSKDPVGRIGIFLQYFMQLDSVANSVATFCKIFRISVPLLIRESAKLLPFLDFANFAFSFLFLGISSYSASQARVLSRKFFTLLSRIDEGGDRAQIFGEVLDLIGAEGEALQEHLLLSKDGQKTLAEKVARLRQHITQQQPIDGDDEAFVRTLAGRVKLQLRFMQADIASEVASIVGSCILLSPVPMAGQAIGLSVIAASGALSVVSWGVRFFLISRNPFDEAPRNRLQQALDAIAGAVHAAKLALTPGGRSVSQQA